MYKSNKILALVVIRLLILICLHSITIQTSKDILERLGVIHSVKNEGKILLRLITMISPIL